MPSLPAPAPAFSLLPSFWALPSFSLPLQGPSDLRLCPSVRWSFPTCSAIQAVPPLSVVPATQRSSPSPPLLPLSSKSQIKGKEGKAEDAMRKESQMEHGPHLSDGPREGASELGWQSRGRRARVRREGRGEGRRKETATDLPTDRPRVALARRGCCCCRRLTFSALPLQEEREREGL